MTFLELTDTAKAYMLVLCIAGFILLLISLIAYISQKYKTPHLAVLSFLLILSILNLSALLQLNKIGRAKYDISLTQIYALSNSIPYLVQIALNLFFISFALLSIYKVYKFSKDQINAFSVKEALENLPTGIAFMTNEVELLLSNQIMHNLAKELTGKTLRNADVFWQDLTTLQDKDSCVIKGKSPAFILTDGRVWQFSKTLCSYNGNEYREFKAIEITEFYTLSENMRNVNEKLMQQQQRLKKLEDIIEENAERHVAVNMKINFHDNFGNLLTLTKKTLRESKSTDEAKALVDYWGNLNGIIKELSSDDRQRLSLEQIMLFAEKLGCEIILSGDIPRYEHNKTTTLLCINEMLKNAYRHAGARMLTVNISQTADTIKLIIQNETEHRFPEIKEGGGLLGLRQRIEQAGGTMKISCDDVVRMSVKMQAGGKQHV